MANSLQTLTEGMGSALRTLDDLFQGMSGSKAFINALGWKLPPGVEDIGLAGIDFTGFLDKLKILLESTEEERDDELLMAARSADLGLAIVALVGSIEELAESLSTTFSGFGDYVDRTNIHKELPRRIFDLLLINHLTDSSPLAIAILNFLDIVEFQYFPADEANFQLEHVRAVIHYDHLHHFVSDPAAHMANAYGWGTPEFAGLDLMNRSSQVLRVLGLPVQSREMDHRAETVISGQPPPSPDAEAVPQVIVTLYERLGEVAGLKLGVSMFSVRPTSAGAADGGIGFLPIARGQAEDSIPFFAFDDTFIDLSGDVDLLKRTALVLRPDRPLQVQKAASLAELPSGRFAIGMRRGKPDSEPRTVASFPGGTRLSMRQFTLGGGLEKKGAENEVFLELGLLGCEATFSLSEADGFVSSSVGRDELNAPFDIRIGWTSGNGLHFRGGAGLGITIPLHTNVGAIFLESLHLALQTEDEGFQIEASTSGSLSIGPVTATVDRLGLLVDVSFGSGNLGLFGLSPSFKPPNGMGLSINAPVVVGGGYLFFDSQKHEYGGILQLEIADTISVKAIGLLTTRMPDGGRGYSLVVIITAEGFAPIQLGFGFTLTGIGGLLGINRTVMVDVLRNGLKNGTLGSVLFPDDPIRNAPQIVSDLRAIFPPVRGRHVFGPMATIGWGTPTILTLEIALLLELPQPVRLIILGRLQAVLPDADHALIRVRMDAIGVIDFNQGDVAVDASLYDSRILEFVLAGDMALRANWGRQPNFVLAVGGLNPRFPPPAGFPKLARLSLSLGDSDNPRLRFESYLALTSNTVQFGARLDFSYSAGGFTLAGFLAFDALFQFSPFEFIADLGAMVALKRGSSVIMGLFLDMTLAGPTPWHVWGKATFKILFFKVSIGFDHRFGREEPPALPPPVDVLSLLAEALGDRRNWSAALPRGEHAIVSLQDVQSTSSSLRVHPLAELTVRQRVVPLNRPVTRFGNVPLDRETTFTAAAVGSINTSLTLPSTPVQDAFALAQYQEMSDEEKLARPAFEAQDAGLQFGVDQVAYQYEALPDTAIAYETLIVDPTRPAETVTVTEPYVLPQAVLDAVVILGAAGQAPIRRSGSSRYRALEQAA